MEKTVGVAEAKAKFSELLDRAAAGEEITITRSGKPRVRIVPATEPRKRKFGMMKGIWPEIPSDLLTAPMSEEDIRWAEGYYQSNGLFYSKADLKKAWKLGSGKTGRPKKRKKASR